MGKGIIMCGLNGVGKSTLGRALAEKLNARFIDNEDLYFPKTDASYTYASPRTRDEVEKLLLQEMRKFCFCVGKRRLWGGGLFQV